jgi:hypothetical protein
VAEEDEMGGKGEESVAGASNVVVVDVDDEGCEEDCRPVRKSQIPILNGANLLELV